MFFIVYFVGIMYASNSQLFKILLIFRSYGTLQFLSALTCEIIQAHGVGNNEEDTWCSDALDILLETWNILLKVLSESCCSFLWLFCLGFA